MKEKECILHGEAYCTPASNGIPKGARKVEHTNDKYHIVADSKTVGNFHVVDTAGGGVQFFEHDDHPGSLFCAANRDTEIFCVNDGRHTPIKIPAGNYEFGIAKEYDPFTENMRRVQD